jgi:NAD(P)-dependent dehydrogenase (short-subunit alcohol dehydrogenase family)
MNEPQVVIVTGGGRGIGFGIGECFADRGGKIAVADQDPVRAEEAAGKLVKQGAADARGFPCDVADRASVEAMVAAVLEAFGRIDVLVNNAGICPFQHIMEMSPETWNRTLAVNLTGAFHCTQVVARHMIERGGGGSIVFITSLADHRTGPTQVDYCASKAGLMGAMTGFAVALAEHGITCNAVAPGHVCTPMTEHWWTSEAGKAKIPQVIPLKRLGTPRDIGEAVYFLSSEQGSYINGITLRVDGGHAAMA